MREPRRACASRHPLKRAAALDSLLPGEGACREYKQKQKKLCGGAGHPVASHCPPVVLPPPLPAALCHPLVRPCQCRRRLVHPCRHRLPPRAVAAAAWSTPAGAAIRPHHSTLPAAAAACYPVPPAGPPLPVPPPPGPFLPAPPYVRTTAPWPAAAAACYPVPPPLVRPCQCRRRLVQPAPPYVHTTAPCPPPLPATLCHPTHDVCAVAIWHLPALQATHVPTPPISAPAVNTHALAAPATILHTFLQTRFNWQKANPGNSCSYYKHWEQLSAEGSPRVADPPPGGSPQSEARPSPLPLPSLSPPVSLLLPPISPPL